MTPQATIHILFYSSTNEYPTDLTYFIFKLMIRSFDPMTHAAV